MSLEIAIQENTRAIRDLIATIAYGMTPTIAQVNAAIAESEAEAEAEAEVQAEPVVETPKAEKTKKAKTEKAPAPSVFEEPKVEAPAKADPVTYQECANAITKLAAAKGRPAAADVLKAFDIAKLPEAKPEQYADIKAAAEAALA